MSAAKRLVIDANILLRGVFGWRVGDLLAAYNETVAFYAPDFCVEEAYKHVPRIARQRRIVPSESEAILNQLLNSFVSIVNKSLYEEFEQRARARISRRDPGDWPVVTTALLLDAPIWTEDRDFFGTGVATWTSDRIELYLRNT